MDFRWRLAECTANGRGAPASGVVRCRRRSTLASTAVSCSWFCSCSCSWASTSMSARAIDGSARMDRGRSGRGRHLVGSSAAHSTRRGVAARPPCSPARQPVNHRAVLMPPGRQAQLAVEPRHALGSLAAAARACPLARPESLARPPDLPSGWASGRTPLVAWDEDCLRWRVERRHGWRSLAMTLAMVHAAAHTGALTADALATGRAGGGQADAVPRVCAHLGDARDEEALVVSHRLAAELRSP